MNGIFLKKSCLNRSAFTCLLFTLLTLLYSENGWAQASLRRYTCFRCLTGIIIDGELTDPGWQDIPWSDAFEDIEGVRRPAPTLETRIKMAWDDSCLYVAARLIEPDLYATLTRRDTIIFHDPDFEVFIDPDGDTQNYYEFEINALGTEMDLFMPRSYSRGGKYDISWDLDGVRSSVNPEGTLNHPSDKDRAWTVELAIPWEAFRGQGHTDPSPGPGTSWRVDFSRVQWNLEVRDGSYRKVTDPSTGKPLPENNWVWSATGLIDMHIPELWGFVDFVSETPPPRWWVWASRNDRGERDWEWVLNDLAGLGIRGILLNADTATLAHVVSLATLLGMEVQAWVWTLNRGDADPSWLDYNRLGKSLADDKAYVDYYKFVNPGLPEVQEFLRLKFRELASVKGLKAIHMDYIRYVDAILPSGLRARYGITTDTMMPEFDYGYHPAMVEQFRLQYKTDPTGEYNPSRDSLWLAFRLGELNRTVALLKQLVQNMGLELTAAVFPTPEMSRQMVRQDWDSWNLDSYFPMVYNGFYEKPVSWIGEVMKENKDLLPDTRMICGLYLPDLQNDDQFTRAVSAALSGGADGIALFSLGSLTDSVRNQIRALEIDGF